MAKHDTNESPVVAENGTNTNEPPDSVSTVTNSSKEVHIPDQEEYLGTEVLDPIPVGDHRVITRNRRGTMQTLFTTKEAAGTAERVNVNNPQLDTPGQTADGQARSSSTDSRISPGKNCNGRLGSGWGLLNWVEEVQGTAGRTQADRIRPLTILQVHRSERVPTAGVDRSVDRCLAGA